MEQTDLDSLSAWIVARGLAGDAEIDLLNGFAARCIDAGLPLSRAIALIDTLHPVYEGRAFLWRHGVTPERPVTEYGRTSEGEAAANWQSSVFYKLLQSGEDEWRCRLEAGETGDLAVLEELRRENETDYLVMVQRFNPEAAIGEMDCFMSRWTTARPGGFSDADLSALRRLVPALGLAIKSTSLARVAESLVQTYLGRDPGRRVLQGRMSRGVVESIRAVLWFSDMKGFTSISESVSTHQLIPLLDDYAEAVISAIHGAGGDVLKLMGDGILAIFNAEDSQEACAAALAAEADLRSRLAELHAKRSEVGEPVASIYLGLHIGDVFYGNIGSKDRLDFTVVGQAVNEVSRIASMCQSADRHVLLSTAFHRSLAAHHRAPLVSVGRYALRGLSTAQELFTILPQRPAAT